MTNYGKYGAAVKTVQMAAEQAAGGYHMSAGDLRTLRLAVDDLQQILDGHRDARGAALRYEDGGYSPAVLLKEGADYIALVYTPQAGEFTKEGAIERAEDAIDATSYTADSWTHYTNSAGGLDYFKREGFSF